MSGVVVSGVEMMLAGDGWTEGEGDGDKLLGSSDASRCLESIELD